MTDDDRERGYRAGKPLTEIIPPDRRRMKAAGLVGGGMVVGAVFVAFMMRTPAPTVTRVTTTPRVPTIQGFALRTERVDLAGERSGPVAPDGTPDWTFELTVNGPVAALALVQCEENGRPRDGARWSTIEWTPDQVDRVDVTVANRTGRQLSVSEDARMLNDAFGKMKSLGDGVHRIILAASTAHALLPWQDGFPMGQHICAYVIDPHGHVVKSPPAYVPNDAPPPSAPPTSIEPFVPAPPFDRGAAAQSLGQVKLTRCARLAGAKEQGRVHVTFAPTGKVEAVSVIEGIDPESPAARCIVQEFTRRASAPAFYGAPVHVKKAFTLPMSN